MAASEKFEKARAWLEAIDRSATAAGFEREVWGMVDEVPLVAWKRSGPLRAPSIYLSAGIHGDEPAGPEAIRQLFVEDALSRRTSWTVCPLLNPRGWVSGRRETPEGIDLNRDYLRPVSVEAATHRQWIASSAPHHLYLSLHEDWETTGFYLYEINTSSGPGFGRSILHAVSAALLIEPSLSIDEHTLTEPGYIVHRPEPDDPERWPEAIFHLKTYPHLSYTFETPSQRPLEQRVAAHRLAVTAALEAFLLQPDKDGGA